MPTGQGNLRTEPFLFFWWMSSESIFPSQWSKFSRFCDEKNHIFWIFVDFCNFWKPRADIFKNLEPGQRILMHFGARPKDFNAFWSRPGFILFVLFVYFYLFLFFSIDFYWFLLISKHSSIQMRKKRFFAPFFDKKITVRKSSFPQPVELVCAI